MVNLPAVRVTALDTPRAGGPAGDRSTPPGLDSLGTSSGHFTILDLCALAALVLRSRWSLAVAAGTAALTIAHVDTWEALGLSAFAAAAVASVMLTVEGHRAEAAVRAAITGNVAARHAEPCTGPDTGRMRAGRRVTVEVVDVLPLPRELTASQVTPAADVLTPQCARAASA